MEKFMRWLSAVGNMVGNKKIKVKINNEKIIINEYEYVFENEVERFVAKKLFDDRRRVRKNETKSKD